MLIPDDLVGLKVIVVSNAESMQIGTFKKFWQRQPVVELNGQDKIVLGIILPYSYDTEELLDRMSDEQQWDWAAAMVKVIGLVDAMRSN